MESGGVVTEEQILDEARYNLKEAGQRIRATKPRLRASDLVEKPDIGELSHRLSAALAATEAAFTLKQDHGAAGSKPRLKTLAIGAKVPTQLRIDHKHHLPELR
jgi:hypothetical protein